jgi:Arc/MetJ family transcription regulator
MGRITVDVNEEWLEAAQELLGTKTKVATINEALRTFALRKKAEEIIAAFAAARIDLTGSEDAWRYGGGRDLAGLIEEARQDDVA